MPFHLICELDDQRQRFRIGQGEHLIGSAADCELRLPFPTISRHHARLYISADRIEIEDLDSSNGSFVDGQRLHGRQRINAGNDMRLGAVTLRLQAIDAGDASLALAIDMSAHGSLADSGQTLPLARSGSLDGRAWDALLAAVAAGASITAMAAHIGDALNRSGMADALEIVDTRDATEDCVLLRHGDASPADSLRVVHDRLYLLARGNDLDPTLLHALLRLLALARQPDGNNLAEDNTLAEHDDEPLLADPHMREIYQRARRIADSDLNVLILGESGTGKEVLAQFIRRHGGADRPYVALNCAALADDLIDAELFGIERGVATGVDARAGKFEQAHGGILFLDEIGDMAAATQARLLRVLQEGEVTRIGGSHPRPARVRVIGATNQSLDTAVSAGRFRLDLLHRIADWQVTLPPLRERPLDIALLAGKFLEEACRARGILISGITRAAHDALLAHDWPGNVRELQREMARAAVFLGNGDALSRVDFGPALRSAPKTAGLSLSAQLEAAERRIIQQAISAAAGNMSDAANRLGVARSTLYRRLEALGLRESDPGQQDD
ncbi:MAG: sigma 54-interacting transcriptional regulator [Lysobacteraceae bacterium]|nr:sigma 54-interacting transcriptional regulator [Xanthomonadaceae bacterium]HRX99556.1 sigma 54-interacting transcriptional regulator [Xanthomonadaceae bacterium]